MQSGKRNGVIERKRERKRESWRIRTARGETSGRMKGDPGRFIIKRPRFPSFRNTVKPCIAWRKIICTFNETRNVPYAGVRRATSFEASVEKRFAALTTTLDPRWRYYYARNPFQPLGNKFLKICIRIKPRALIARPIAPPPGFIPRIVLKMSRVPSCTRKFIRIGKRARANRNVRLAPFRGPFRRERSIAYRSRGHVDDRALGESTSILVRGPIQ
jgi:hypothetical protein